MINVGLFSLSVRRSTILSAAGRKVAKFLTSWATKKLGLWHERPYGFRRLELQFGSNAVRSGKHPNKEAPCRDRAKRICFCFNGAAIFACGTLSAIKLQWGRDHLIAESHAAFEERGAVDRFNGWRIHSCIVGET
jgi:hypothetical protein